MTTPPTQPTAAEAYAERRSDIARLLDVLDMELEKHGQAARADPGNWGRVGDLSRIRAGLVEMVAFLAGMTEAQVEEFLGETP